MIHIHLLKVAFESQVDVFRILKLLVKKYVKEKNLKEL